MCGRYEIQASSESLIALFDLENQGLSAELEPLLNRSEVRPSNDVLVVLNQKPKRLQSAVWGYLDSWSERLRPFNARDDKLLGRSWKSAFETRRCLIPATAFFEWKVVPGQKRKQPVRFSMRDGAPFCFAGLWNRSDGKLSCTIITTRPSTLVAPIHDRMPAILDRAERSLWIQTGTVDSGACLRPFPSELMVAEEVDPSLRSKDLPRPHPQLKLL